MSTAVGLERSLRIMAATPNTAVVPVLTAALGSNELAVRVGAAKALAARVDGESHCELLRTLPVCRRDVRSAVTTDSQIVARLRKSALEGLKHGDATLRQRICRYAVDANDHRLLPTIVDQAIQPDNLAGESLATAALKLTRSLKTLIDAPPQGEGADQRDIAYLQRTAVRSLNHAVDQFGDHRRRELLEAFLLVTPADSPLLRRVLKDLTHPVRQSLVAALGASPGKGAMDVLIQALEDTSSTDELLTLAAERCDLAYTARLLTRFAPRPGARVIQNVHRLSGFGWASAGARRDLLQLSGAQQAAALRLFFAAETVPSDRLAFARLILGAGADEGRIAACESLRRINLPEVAELLAEAIDDPCPQVVAAAAAQLRRHLENGSLLQLVNLLDHSSREVVQAAQESLQEFTLEQYRGAYEKLSPEQRAAAGRLVGKADPKATNALAAELRSPATSRRIEALQSIADLAIVDRLLDPVIKATRHNDAAIRAEAARALGGSASPTVVEPLAQLLADASTMVQDVAEASLRQINGLDLAQELIKTLEEELEDDQRSLGRPEEESP